MAKKSTAVEKVEKPAGPVVLSGPGGDKHQRDFAAEYVGTNDGVPKQATVTGVCDEGEAIRILRLRYGLGAKDGRFNVTETDESLAKSKQRLAEREERKKNAPATGGL